jgi:uncharacterized protein
MKCPVCPESTLLMSDRQGVEIDYCPSCRGVWLDRGELDKLVQLAGRQDVRPDTPRAPDSAPRRDFEDSDFRRQHRGESYRRKSWLSEIFD